MQSRARTASKRDRIRRREEADSGREVLPEEAAKAEAFIARMAFATESSDEMQDRKSVV